jgi:hypothetical protein
MLCHISRPVSVRPSALTHFPVVDPYAFPLRVMLFQRFQRVAVIKSRRLDATGNSTRLLAAASIMKCPPLMVVMCCTVPLGVLVRQRIQSEIFGNHVASSARRWHFRPAVFIQIGNESIV